VTDNQGRFRIQGISGCAGQTSIVVSASLLDVGSTEQSLVLSGDSVENVELILQKPVIVPPPTPVGVAGIRGTVGEPVPTFAPCSINCPVMPEAGCTVIVAPAYVPMLANDIKSYGPGMPGYVDQYRAITDSNGNYSIDNIVMWSNEYYVFIMANKGNLKGNAQATLVAGKVDTVNVSLFPDQIVPPPIISTGIANLTGIVYESDCPSNPASMMPCMLQPVPGCTVMVAPAALPLMATSTGSSVSGSVYADQWFAAITDAQGRYYLGGIPVYGDAYSIAVMAQKNMRFGYTQAQLVAGLDNTADIVLEKYDGNVDTTIIVYPDSVIGGPGDTVYADPYQLYYSRNAAEAVNKISAVGQKPAKGNIVAIRLTVLSNGLTVSLPLAQKISISVMGLNGRLLDQVTSNRLLSAGSHSIAYNWTKFGNKPMILHIKGESFSQSQQVNVLGSR
jgi:hypothetical protein